MRVIIFIIISFLFIPLTFKCQTKIEGIFCLSGAYEGHYLNFSKDSLFEFSCFSCTNNLHGQGVYKRKKKKLYLTFINEDSVPTKSSFKEKEVACNSEDSVTFKFTLIEKDTKEPISFGHIEFPEAITNAIKKYSATNMDGELIKKFKKSSKEIQIMGTYVGYERCIFTTKTDMCKNIIISLSDGINRIIANGTIWIYKIKENTNTKLILIQNKKEIILTRPHIITDN